MAINLSISFSCPGSIAQQISYARIDNVPNPVYVSVANINGSSGNVVIASDIPDGQYVVSRTPIFADGRICSARTLTTPSCPGLISISAVIQGGVLVVTYLAPSTSPSVLINVNYPNGGSFSQIYPNTGNPISIGLPAGVYGNYTVNGQSVCDSSSGFYSPPSSSVTVLNAQPISGTYFLGNTQTQVCSASSTTLYSQGAPVTGSTLYLDNSFNTAITGYSLVMYQGVIYNLDSTQGILGSNSGLACGPTVSVSNALAPINVNQINGIVGFTYSVTTGPFSQTGSHSAFTGSIGIVFSGTVSLSVPGRVVLYKNGTVISCTNFTPGTYSNQPVNLGTFSFLVNDTINLSLDSGTC